MKSILLALTSLSFYSTVYAQFPRGEISAAYNLPPTADSEIANMIAPLDKSSITTNLFMDIAFQIIDFKLYDESFTPDIEPIDFSVFTRLYGTFNSSALLSSSKLPDPKTTYIPLMKKVKETDVIPILILDMNYHRLKDNAFDDNLIYEQNGQFFDNVNRTEEPYIESNIFVATSLINEIGEMKARFRIDENLFFKNTGKIISSVEVNFGNGFQTVSLNQPFENSFSNIGENNFDLKVKFTDGSIKISEIAFKINRFSTTKRYEFAPDETKSFNATSEHSGGLISISYSCGNDKLLKPLIVVEGLHPTQFPAADQHYSNFIFEITQNNLSLKNELEIGGYDLVYIDFTDGAESVQRKSALLKEVINWVNTEKGLNNSNEKNVVFGISMGCLVSRFTLKTMEDQGLNHDCRKLLTQDGGQYGANIPLGYQYMVLHLANHNVGGNPMKDFIPALQLAEDMLHNMGARQLLIEQAYFEDSPDYVQLMTDFDALGYPNIEMAAVSNGSEIVEGQGFSPHSQLFHSDLSSYYFVPFFWQFVTYALGSNVQYKADVWALPENNTTPEKIYEGKFRHIIFYIPVAMDEAIIGSINGWPYDSGPGGYHDISDFFGSGSLPSSATFYYTKYSHIPTPSALGVNPPAGENNYYNVQAANIIGNSLTPFSRYAAVNDNILPNIDNEPHTAFSINSAALMHDFLIDFDQSMNDNLLTTISNETYNYGSTTNLNTTHRQIYDVVVDANGKYCANSNIGIGYLSAGNGVATSGSNFDVYIGGGDCNTQGAKVTVNSGGEFIIGDNSTSNTSTVYFQDISELILNSGGKLIIRDNCTVILESESKFTFMDGAQIELQGNNAVLEIRGDVVLGNNALLTFTGSGFVRWDVPYQGFSNVTAGSNAGIKFQGSGRTDKVLEIKGPDLWLPNNLSVFQIQAGLVEFFDDSRLVIPCPFFLIASNFVTSTTPLLSSRGVWVAGQSGMYMAGCHFYNTDVDGDLIYGGNPLKIQSCQFFDYSNVMIDGAGLQIVNSNFTNCPNGIEVQDIYLPSYYNIGNMNQCIEAVSNYYANTSMSFYKVNINSSNTGSTWGIFQHQGLLNLKCTQITGSQNGIWLYQGGSLSSSIIGTIGGYSKINGSTAGINLMDAGMVNLDNGFNDLRSGYKIITGDLALPCQGNPYNIPANQNKWLQNNNIDPNTFPGASAGGYYPNAYINPSAQGSCDVRFVDNNRTDPVSCGAFDGGGGPLTGVFRNCTNCPMINTPHFNNVRMDDAVVMAMEHMEITDSTKNDFLAIIMFNEIVAQTQLDLTDPDVAFLARYCYQMAKISFQNCFNTGRLTKANNIPSLHNCGNHYLEILDALRQPVDESNFKEQFYLELDNALIYYWVGRYSDAISNLNNIENCYLGDDEYKLLEYWKATITLKNEFVNNNITIDQYIEKNKSLPRISNIKPTAIDPSATINPTADIGSGTQIGSGTSVGQNVIIGKNCIIGSNVSIDKDVVIGDRVVIADNSTIGKETAIGSETTIGSNTDIDKESQIGENVAIGNNVSIAKQIKIGDWSRIDDDVSIDKETGIADGTYIGVNASIEKQTNIGSHAIIRRNSVIERENKIGNDVIIDNNTLVKKQSKIGKNVIIGQGLTIGNNAKLCDLSVVNSNVPNNGTIGSCFSPSLPSQPFNVTHDEIFAVTHAHIYGKMEDGFIVTPSADHYFVGQTLTFDAKIYGSDVSWDFGNCSNSTGSTAMYTFVNPGVYVITLKVNPPSGCTNGISQTYIGSVSIHPKPIIKVDSEVPECPSSDPVVFDFEFDPGNINAPGCMSKYGTYCTYSQLKSELCRLNISSNYGDGITESNQYLFSQMFSGISKEHVYLNPQSYNYNFIGEYEAMQLTTENWVPIEYETEVSGSVSLINSTEADFVLDEFVCSNSTYTIINTSFAPYELSYIWNLSDGQTSTDANPVFNFSVPGVYTLTLEASDLANSCSDTKEFVFTITNCQLHSMTIIPDETINESTIENLLEVKLFPNPNSGEFSLVIDGLEIVENSNVLLAVYDSYGKLVYTQSKIMNGTTKVNMTGLATGIYHWSIVDMNNKKTNTGNFIINK